MPKLRFAIPLAALLAVAVVRAQQPPSGDPETCAKRCQEMKASHQKAMEARQAAWKEIEAQLEIARNARGDQKVAALESAVDKLVAYEASAPHAMAECPMTGGTMPGHGPGPGHGRGHGPMAGAGMACCARSGAGAAAHDCPMMKGSAGPPEASKPAN